MEVLAVLLLAVVFQLYVQFREVQKDSLGASAVQL